MPQRRNPASRATSIGPSTAPTDQAFGSGEGELSGVMPLGPGGAKSITELLGELFTAPNAGRAFPKVMRLSSLNPETDVATLHDTKTFAPFESTITELRKLIRGGELQPAGPPEGRSVASLVKLLRRSMK